MDSENEDVRKLSGRKQKERKKPSLRQNEKFEFLEISMNLKFWSLTSF